MYERSAIVLEKYLEEILKLNKTYNLKKNSENYNELVNEIEQHQLTTNKDVKIIQDFDDTVGKIESIQREQQKLYKINKKLEEDRAQLFTELGEDARILENKLKRIEKSLEKNSQRMAELREGFVKNLKDFAQKQKYRNKCDKERRVSEAKNIKRKEELIQEFKEIDVQDIVNLKDFIASEKEQVKVEALNIMTKNGKNERVPFNQDVLRKAINNRIDIAEKEAECYVLMYDRMKKLLQETDTETIKLDKYKRVLRDCTVRLAFLKAQREYIVGFLDYERMTAINGQRVHKRMMIEACNNFELDMIQIKKLYELILREASKKATKAAYKELYNKNYLKNIEDKEKNFEEEANNVNIKTGTLLNSNYWRIEGIKNIYMVFQQEVSEKYEKDLSEYSIEENDVSEEISKEQIYEEENEYEYDNDYEEESNEDYDEDNYEEELNEDYDDDNYEEELDEDYDDDNYEEELDEDYDYDNYEGELDEDYDNDNYEEELDEDYDNDNYEEELDEDYDDGNYEEELDEEYDDEDYENYEEEIDEEYDDEDYDYEEESDENYDEEFENEEENYYEKEIEDYDEYNYRKSPKSKKKNKDRISDSFNIEDIEGVEDLDQLIKNSREEALQKNKKNKKTEKQVKSKENKSKKINKQDKEVKQNRKQIRESRPAKHAAIDDKKVKKDNKGLLNKLFKK